LRKDAKSEEALDRRRGSKASEVGGGGRSITAMVAALKRSKKAVTLRLASLRPFCRTEKSVVPSRHHLQQVDRAKSTSTFG
jgi:hypothetical protein